MLLEEFDSNSRCLTGTTGIGLVITGAGNSMAAQKLRVRVYFYGQTLNGPPLPPHCPWSRMPPPPPRVGGVWGPSSPCGVVVGFWGLGFSSSC